MSHETKVLRVLEDLPRRSSRDDAERRRVREVLRRRTGIALAVVIATGVITSAQKNPYLKYTEEKFVENKLTADRNFAAVKTFVGAADYASAKAQLTRAREQMAITITFWRDAKNDAAVAMLRKTLTSMDDLDVAMSAATVDAGGVTRALARIDEACTTCHTAYREQDPATNSYRVKRATR